MVSSRILRSHGGWLAVAAALVIIAPSSAAQGAPTPEDVARRQYASGLEFLRAGKSAEALKDFQTVVESYPGSSVADDALLAIARYQLEGARDPAAAQATAESVLKKFPASDSVAMAYVVAGQALVEQGLSQSNVDAALASFERVPRLFPGTRAVAPAVYAAGETFRRLNRCDEALARLAQVGLEYPRSDWAARSKLSSARCLVAKGRVPEAMAALYNVTALFPDTDSAQTARALGTILYRLHVRPPAEPAFVASDRTLAPAGTRLRDVTGLTVAPDGSLLVAGRTGVLMYNAAAPRAISAGEMRGLALDRRGRVVAAQRGLLVQQTAPPPGAPVLLTLTVPRPDGPARILSDLAAVAVLSSGERLVADRELRTVYRFSEAGKFLAPFASVRAARIAIGPTDTIALLDRDTKTISLFDASGRATGRITARGTGYELTAPADLAFDAVGHLYVLDRSGIVVFAPDGQTPVVTFTDPPRAAGGLRNATALAIDPAGRLYVYDDGAERVVVYE
jgi:TolA-binding protein